MNGLEYIRTRCNISQAELADILQVTKQAISMWENGKKEIPPKRREELSRFFGLDEGYFGEIYEEQKDALQHRAMFRHDVNGREAYRFRPEDGATSLQGMEVHFFAENEQSFDVGSRIREYCADDSVVRCDEPYIRRMAALMREHMA